ncbi:FAD-dependent oxidoreductase [Streptomyces capparidis]
MLIIGGGSAGNSLAVLLRATGVEVDLVEASEDWNALGSGIILHGNALRVLRDVGVWERVAEAGVPFDTITITAPDGTVVNEQQDLRSGGPDLPASLGITRPRLQRILIDAVRASGTKVRLGCEVRRLHQDNQGVTASFSDGTHDRYDLVAACDGVNSATRKLIGIPDEPVDTGMVVWRVLVPRGDDRQETHLAYGGPCYIAGTSPMGDDTWYAWFVEEGQGPVERSAYVGEMLHRAAAYGGRWEQVRGHLSRASRIHRTGFVRHLVEGPWHRGRVVLVGDAAHACPPTLAQGAAMSLEDAAVLAELVAGKDSADEEVLSEYRARRDPRVRMVVDGSMQLGQWLRDGQQHLAPGLIAGTLTSLAACP